ncbi:MAG TPA: Rid family detoxifying hydrolase [archaeon]|nr:Rid family detoxifying hydrolase [archaeon]
MRGKKAVESLKAPKAIGPYSQAVSIKGFVFVSGQIALNPETGKIVEGGIAEHVNRIFDNIEALLSGAGLSLENVVRVEVFLKDLDDFKEMNAVYAERFSSCKVKPARQTIQAAKLPMDALIEISCIAFAGKAGK